MINPSTEVTSLSIPPNPENVHACEDCYVLYIPLHFIKGNTLSDHELRIAGKEDADTLITMLQDYKRSIGFND